MVKIETFDQNKIANGFNKFFTKGAPKLASSIPTSFKDFKHFMNGLETVLQEYTLQGEKQEETFNSLRSNKSPGFCNISSSIVESVIFFIHSSIFLLLPKK